MTIVPVVIGDFGTVTKELLKSLEDLEVGGRVGDHPNKNIIENVENTEKSPEDLKRIAVTQSPVKNHQLTLMGKSLMSNDNNNNNIQRGIFQGDALSPLLFIIAMMPFNDILRKCTVGYKLSRSQEKVNHLLYMDDIKLYA